MAITANKALSNQLGHRAGVFLEHLHANGVYDRLEDDQHYLICAPLDAGIRAVEDACMVEYPFELHAEPHDYVFPVSRAPTTVGDVAGLLGEASEVQALSGNAALWKVDDGTLNGIKVHLANPYGVYTVGNVSVVTMERPMPSR